MRTTKEGSPKFKLLTFNLWGLKFVSHYRHERLHAIADRLAAGQDSTGHDDYDIVALQEVWCQDDWDYFDRVCATRYPYRRCFSSGMISGPGLAILSRFPIAETFLYRYPVNGRPSAFYRGDWYVGKSAAVTIIEPDLAACGTRKTFSTRKCPRIALVNSHMHAPYALQGDAAYECHRTAQAWDLSGILTRLKRQGYAVILVGDLNSRPGTLPHKILTKIGGMKDSWELLHKTIPKAEIARMSPSDQVKFAGTTCDSNLNTWRAYRDPSEACRLDYALIGGDLLKPLEASVAFTERIPDVGSYSDHFAYTATFSFVNETVNDSKDSISGSASSGSGATSTTKEVSADTGEQTQFISICSDAKALLLDYLLTTARKQKLWRGLHFIASMLVMIAFIPVIVVVSIIAPWTSVLFYIFGCVIAVTGVIDGLLSFLFGRNEKRAIREIIMQIDDRVRFIKLLSRQAETN